MQPHAPLHSAIALACVALLTACSPHLRTLPHTAAAPAWRPLDAGAFEEARASGAFVLLSLQASWCHFCHVMNDETFADAEVQARLAAHFVTVREEADRRPDLVARWGLYGWPATIVLDADGNELVALRGFRPPEEFRTILDTLVADRAAGRVPGSSLPPALRAGPATSRPFEGELSELLLLVQAQADATYDVTLDGWGTPQKYPFGGLVEHALARERITGDAEWGARARGSLRRHVSLIDPVWGGIYQYSVDGVWDHPHYEKLAAIQASTLESLAAAIEADEDDAAWRTSGEAILRYLGERLRSPEGTFYVSQDADVRGVMDGHAFYALDDAGRRAVGGEPTIDQHIDADVNGLLIAALARYGFAARDARALAWAETAADAVWSSHCGDGGCAHEVGDARRHLVDQGAMLAGLLQLYQATADARHLEHARALATYIETTLVDADGGLRTSTREVDGPDLGGAVRPFVASAVTARALLVLDRIDEDRGHADVARRALLSLGDRELIGRQGRIVGELLLALDLAVHGTVRFTLVGAGDDARTAALRDAVRDLYEPRRVLEQVLPGASRYGDPGEPALFVCGADACSFPMTDPGRVADSVRTFLASE